jgi:hypothetical protein
MTHRSAAIIMQACSAKKAIPKDGFSHFRANIAK